MPDAGSGFRLTRAAIHERLAAPRAATPRGDLLTAGIAIHQAASSAPHVPAAVLVPLIEHDDGFSVLFTQRTSFLKAHAGQISFPGGRCEPGDADACASALREAQEEIGLAPDAVDVLGRLDSYFTVTGFEVMPVVGAVTPPLELKPDPTEVAEIFEVPLAFLMDPANHQRHTRTVNGMERPYIAMPYGSRYIWGATAGMLVNLYDVLTAAEAAS